MSTAVGSFWSPDIRPNVLSPYAILAPQADALTKITNGLLVGDVKAAYDKPKQLTYLSLDIVVPALDQYRHRVLTVTHRTDVIYPARIDAECFRPNGAAWTSALLSALSEGKKADNEAASDKEFSELLQKVLQSDEVKSLAVSLIARANDVLLQRQQHAGTSPGPEPDGAPKSPEDDEGEEEETSQG